MPVILDYDAYDLWLKPTDQPSGTLNHLLKPYPAEEMTAYPVSSLVNRPQNDTPAYTLPIWNGRIKRGRTNPLIAI